VEGRTVSHYRILEKIGDGGMGEVFLAEDTHLNRKVALKFLSEYLQRDDVAQKRFLREAQSAAALDHPYICKIYEVGEADGKNFIAMEYVKGQTLKERMLEGPVPLKQTLQIGMEIAEALEEAHKAGIAHRDLKPANIMRTSGGHVKLMDFGLAKKILDEEGTEQDITSALTREGTTLGTLAYMSPEQLRGKKVDTRSDIFSFGIVLYELLSGIHPFRRPKQVDTTDAILREDPAPLSRYTEDTADLLQHTVEKMLEKNPDNRYQTVHEVRSNLKKLSEKLSGPVEMPPVPSKRRLNAWWLAPAILVVLVGVFLGIYLFRPSPMSTEGTRIDAIAIPPFVNVTGDEESASLCVGIPESISTQLAHLQHLRIKPTSVLLRYEGTDLDPQQVSGEQGVRAVLIGRVEHRGNTLVVSINLIDGRDNTLIVGKRYSPELVDIFAVEEEIAREVARELLPELTSEETESLAQSGTTNPEAYPDFMVGQYHVLGDFDLRTAIIHLKSAISKDPKYQEAYRLLAASYFQLARTETQSLEDYAEARKVAERCIAADHSTVIAHEMKAAVFWQYERKWQEAEREYAKAIELDPSFEKNIGFLDWMGRREEALAEIEKLVERADPLSSTMQSTIGFNLLWHSEFDRVIEQAKKMMDLNPQSQSARWILSMSYEQKGMEKAAFDETLQALRLEDVGEAEIEKLQEAFRKSGLKAARKWEAAHRVSKVARPDMVAWCYLQLGDMDKACEWLEKSWLSDLPLWGLENAPSCWKWDSLRSDPRFEELLRKLNLPEEAIQRHLRVQ